MLCVSLVGQTLMGLIMFDLPASLLGTAFEQLSEAGFHKLILGRMNTRLFPDNIMSGVMEAEKIAKW